MRYQISIGGSWNGGLIVYATMDEIPTLVSDVLDKCVSMKWKDKVGLVPCEPNDEFKLTVEAMRKEIGHKTGKECYVPHTHWWNDDITKSRYYAVQNITVIL